MSVKIYKTQLTPARNALLDNIEDYLKMIENHPDWYTGEDALTYSSENFQYIRPDIDIKIKLDLPLSNNNLYDSIGNYLRLEQRQTDKTGAQPVPGEVAIWYYFIIASRWISQGTIELTCSMDTVNTFQDYVNDLDHWDARSHIMREHEDNIEGVINKKPNIPLMYNVSYKKTVDRYSEDYQPSVLLKKSDTVIEEPNTIGVKEWYLVYMTKDPALDTGASKNSMTCYLYPSETFVYQRQAGVGPQTFTKKASIFTGPRIYGIVNGGVSFKSVPIGMRYMGYTVEGLSMVHTNSSFVFQNLKRLTLTGSAKVGDTATTSDGKKYVCESVIWYNNADISGNPAHTNIPMGVFVNGDDRFLATYITEYNGTPVEPQYYAWTRWRDWNFGWFVRYLLRPVSGTPDYDIGVGYTLIENRTYHFLNDTSFTDDNTLGRYDNNWGRNSIHNIGDYVMTFDNEVLNIYKVPYSKNIPDVSYLASGDAIYTNGTGSLQYSIQAFTDLDRTDSKLVKIIALPYCPTPITISGSIESGSYAYSFDSDIIDIENIADKMYRLVYKDSNNPSFGKALNPYIYDMGINNEELQDYYERGILSLKNIENEGKLLNSAYTKFKYIYDASFKEIRMEDVAISKGSSTFKVIPTYMPTNTIDSKILYKFDFKGADYNQIYEWDTVMISTRDNELPIYNNDYLNYVRYGLKTERENLEASAAAQTQQAETSAALGIGGGTLSGALLGSKIGAMAGGAGSVAGAIIGGAIGLAASLAASSAALNATNTNIANAERAMSQKALELQNTASSVRSGAAAVDLMTYYTGNRLHHMEFGLPPLLEKALYDKLFYCGYSHPVQGLPKLDTRAIFNFVQCSPVFKNESTNRYAYYIADIKDRFSTGITKYHNISDLLYNNKEYASLYTDWDQKFENWPFDRNVRLNLTQTYQPIEDDDSAYANRSTLTFGPNTGSTLMTSGTNGFYYTIEQATTQVAYKAGRWTNYLDKYREVGSIIPIDYYLTFNNGALLPTPRSKFNDREIPYALKFTLKNDVLGFSKSEIMILDKPADMSLRMPEITEAEYAAYSVESNYTVSTSSSFKYQLAINYNGTWKKYPYDDDTDYANDYTTASIFRIIDDATKRGYVPNDIQAIYARVINVNTGAYSQWFTYPIK